MGQHLHLYASKSVTEEEVNKWCRARAYELIEIPSAEDQPAVDKVSREMDRLRKTGDHFEHWSNWCGVMIWEFLIWKAHVCDAALVSRAVFAASKAMESHDGLRNQYPSKDFTADTPIAFLEAHTGFVVWGDNDGI